MELLTKDEINQLLSYCHKKGWQKGQFYGFTNCWVDLDWVYDKINFYFQTELNVSIKPTILKYVNKYCVGDKNPLHHDCSPNSMTKNNTVYSINILLNDDFGGGNFILNNKTIDLKVGYPIHYKSNIMHQVTEITSGERYTLSCFIKKNDIVKNINSIL